MLGLAYTTWSCLAFDSMCPYQTCWLHNQTHQNSSRNRQRVKGCKRTRCHETARQVFPVPVKYKVCQQTMGCFLLPSGLQRLQPLAACMLIVTAALLSNVCQQQTCQCHHEQPSVQNRAHPVALNSVTVAAASKAAVRACADPMHWLPAASTIQHHKTAIVKTTRAAELDCMSGLLRTDDVNVTTSRRYSCQQNALRQDSQVV